MAEHSGFLGGSIGDNMMQELTNDIGPSKSPRILVPLLHLYLERVFELVLEKHWEKSHSVVGERSGYLEKVKLLYARNLIDDDRYKSLKAINNIRNAFAHSFNPKDETIEKYAKDLEGHDWVEEKYWLERYLSSCIDSMSVLTSYLDRK